jgi:hypothetical protein
MTRQGKFIAFGAHIVALLAAFLYFPWAQDGPTLCLFRKFTAIPCPSCGLTRAFGAILHGNFAAAIAFHHLSLLMFALVLASAVVLAVDLWRKTDVWSRIFNKPTTYLAVAIALFANWLVALAR